MDVYQNRNTKFEYHNSLGAREGEKKPKKEKKNEENFFFVLNKYQSVTHVST